MTIAASPWFYHGHVRRLIVAFGELFTGMKLVRFNPDGSVKELVMEVPCTNATADKFFDRKQAQPEDDGDLRTRGGQVYPQIGYEFVGMNYARDRQAAALQRTLTPIGNDLLRRTLSPVPYDFNFELIVSARNMTDATQIVEQILPWFAPSHTMVLVDYPYIGQHVDVAVFLEGMTFTDNANDPLEDGSRQVIFKLEFIAQYWLYGPSGSTLEVLVNKMIEDKLGIPETNTPQVVKATKKTTIRIHSEIDRFYLSDNADLVISMDPTGKTVIEL